MSKPSLACWVGIGLLFVAGCGGGDSESSQQPTMNNGGGNAAAGGGPAAAPGPAGAGMPGMPVPGVAGGAAAPGAATPAAAPGAAAPAPVAGGGGPTNDINTLIPSTAIMAVGAVPSQIAKDSPVRDVVFNQIEPLLKLFQRIQIKPDDVERFWAASNRGAGDMVLCVRTRGPMDAAAVVKALGGFGKAEKIGRAQVFSLPDHPQFKNAIGLIDNRTALIGRRQSVEEAAKGGAPGPVRLGLEAIAPSRCFYWMAGDEGFGNSHLQEALLAMMRIKTEDDIEVSAEGFAMGIGLPVPAAPPPQQNGANAGFPTPGAPAAPGSPMPGAPAIPGGAPATGTDLPGLATPGAPTAPGSTGSGQPPANAVELTFAATLKSEALVGKLEDELKVFVALADAADIARQEYTAKAKAAAAAAKAAADNPAPGGGAPGMPGMPPGAGGMPPGAGGVPPGAPAGPGAGMPIPGGPGAPGGGGGSYHSRIPHPAVAKDKARVRISFPLPYDEKERTKLVGFFGQVMQTAGATAISDGIYEGTLEMMGRGFQAWAKAKPKELRGLIEIPDSSRVGAHSWLSQLLPYLGHDDLYVRIDFKKSWADDKNSYIGQNIVPAFINPGSTQSRWTGIPLDGMALTHFVGMSGLEIKRSDCAGLLARTDPRAGIFGYTSIAKPEEITDGQSQTIMLIGADRLAGPWMQGGGGCIRGARAPYFNEFSGFNSSGLAKPGTYILFADGSSRVVSADIDPEIFKALCTIHGAETIDMSKLVENGLGAAPAGTATAQK